MRGFCAYFFQTTTYYPYGSAISSLSSGAPTVPNDYKYNNKEFVDDLGLNMLDYGARLYDPLTGRWNGVDALAEKFASHSSYHYVLGNPIRYGDRDGRDTTVYVYFDPASEYFGGVNNKANRDEVLRGMRLLYKLNGIKLNVTETTRDIDKLESLMDPTDQIVSYTVSVGFSNVKMDKGYTTGYNERVSYVNLKNPTFDADGVLNSGGLYTKRPIDYRALSNTGVHESFHGYLSRAERLFVGASQMLNLSSDDDPGHLNNPANIMQSGSLRSNSKIPNKFLANNNTFFAEEKLVPNHKLYINYYLLSSYNPKKHKQAIFPLQYTKLPR